MDRDTSDEEMDWEEVPVDLQIPVDDDSSANEYNGSRGNIEITLESKNKVDSVKKRLVMSNAERLLRLDSHKIHTVCLLANACVRNRWINDRLLHARLMSLTPLSLQHSFMMISKKQQPDPVRRARQFEAAMMRLTEWWYTNFEVIPTGHLHSRTFDEVNEALSRGSEEEKFGEVIRSVKSLMKHALMRRGSRDVSAQLFTSLCRALGVPARLVVSLQSVPWQAKVGRPKPHTTNKKGKGKGKAVEPSDAEVESGEEVNEDEDEDMEEVEIPMDVKGKGQERAFPGDGQTLNGSASITSNGKVLAKPVIKFRKTKPMGNRLGSSTSSSSRRQSPGPPVGGYPPVFWTEVFSRPDGRWLSVDPIRYIVNKRKVFDPPPHDKNNRMVYVVAFEEDGYARDVTARYAREYGARTTKVQVGGKGRKEWWESVMRIVTRPFRLHRDDVEDEELEIGQLTQGMPTSIAGFKDHPLYALTRHLKREEVVYPLTELGKFRGEPVYSRASVIALKTAENWMRMGHKIKEGEQPMKLVKQRAVTIHRRREIEVAGKHGMEEVMQGLYAEPQTELYVADPIIDGKVPKNDFGNIDLYVPSMLPSGAAHVPFKGVAKIARQLKFDYAEAVTGFEFKKRRAFPIITGVVVATENETPLLEAYWESQQDADEKQRLKRQERVIKRWTRLIHGLRIRKRLQEQYSGRGPIAADAPGHVIDENKTAEAGGFLTSADDVVQAFNLPKFQHAVVPSGSLAPTSPSIPFQADEDISLPATNKGIQSVSDNVNSFGPFDDAHEWEEIFPVAALVKSANGAVPRTMQELAEDAERTQPSSDWEDGDENAYRPTSRTPGSKKPLQKIKGLKRRIQNRTKEEETGSEQSSSSPSKRLKSTPETPVLAFTRTLRTRPTKTETKLREEMEMEEAFRRAVAE